MEVVLTATEGDFLEVFKTDPRWEGRGWPDRFIFTGFPRPTMTWQWVTISDDEMLNLFHIRGGSGGGWNVIAGPDYRVSSAAQWFRENPTHDVALKVDGIRRHLDGDGDVPPILVMGTSLDGDLVLMDGNHRVAAAVQAGLPADQLRFLVGTSPHMERWVFYKDI